MATTIGERIYDQHHRDGSTSRLRVSLDLPEPDPHPGGDWQCTYHFEFPDRNVDRRIFGVDSLQAIELALMVMNSELDGMKLTITNRDPES